MLFNYFSSDSPSDLYKLRETLAVVNFNTDCVASPDGAISSGLRIFGEPVNEVWGIRGESIEHGQTGRCSWRQSSEIICAAIWLSADECADIEASTQDAYAEILATLSSQGYPYPFRFWNYIPKINHGDGDQEEYKKFCSGRLQAFRQTNLAEESFPAASALGHHTHGGVVYVLSSKHTGIHHKNQLQTDAYKYPRQYGANSPSFARATSITVENQDLFFISGTASIIGHKTMAVGDLKGQLDTTVNNIQHLIDHAKQEGCAASLKTIKAYIRHEQDLATCKAFLETRFPDTPTIFLHADVCRDDLLVEIECFFG